MAVRRTKQEIIAELDAKITYHEDCINKLKAKKEQATKPPKERVRKNSMKKALEAIKEIGLTPDEIMAFAAKAKKAKDKEKE